LIGTPFKNFFSTDPERAEMAHQTGAERKEGHRLANSPPAPGTAGNGGFLQCDHLLRPRWEAAGRVSPLRAISPKRKRLDQILQEKNIELIKAQALAEKGQPGQIGLPSPT